MLDLTFVKIEVNANSNPVCSLIMKRSISPNNEKRAKIWKILFAPQLCAFLYFDNI